MRRVATFFLVPLLSAGCGSAPLAPSPQAATAPRGVALSLQISPDAQAGQGWRPPTAVNLRVASPTSIAAIEKAIFRMVNDRGETLSEGTLSENDPIPLDAYLDATTVVQTLRWPPEQGAGKRLDISVTVRSVSGEVFAVNTSFASK